MVKIDPIFLGLIFLILIGLGLTFIAKWRGISPLSFWIVPIATCLPWFLATILVMIASSFEEPRFGNEAAPMAALFPLFGMFGFFFIGIIISFVLEPKIQIKQRIFWPMLISGVLALIVGGFISILFIFNL
jgi:peptidoglycan/LPS O-acetylase OafA/YrhL